MISEMSMLTETDLICGDLSPNTPLIVYDVPQTIL